MFSFHKPKVYRSSKGCCICKAKSSSSRFTDSKKYEDDFIKCFVLEERRTGEICNACVLLVKRWKKLPVGTDRNWNHVVDARAGPGIKSLTKFKSKNKKKKLKDVNEKLEKIIKKKHVYQKREREDSPAMSDDFTEEDCNGSGSKNSSRAGSPEENCDTITEAKLLNLALSYFKQEMICCGMVFKGRNGEVMMDGTLVKPCSGSVSKRQQQQQLQQQQQQQQQEITTLRKSPSTSPSHSSASTSPAYSVESAVESSISKLSKPIMNHRFYESSSDSGYDESSNQGVGESKLAKIIQNSTSSIGIKVEPPKNVTLKTIPISEAVRIKNEVPIKLVPMKPISLSTNLTLSNLTLNDGTSITSNPLVDFAIHASSRQPVTN
ncbi:SIN3-HDAC complex-associated factor [Leptopilina boulardi]|uniref:SIN3-HDAC complex-associated factor n=1 Tax=Leptopilina boulardi TaxID=63433 RepID=UPI0021F612AC|nr:SIN3-HDAC complex-associated factor [Leptopilina boulardi]XP_051175564.1 SIN3-HDAC complex-associated factor [Leptopilina boulardi]